EIYTLSLHDALPICMIRTTAFPRGEYWTALISALEDSLRLHRHQPGALAGLEENLHRRTGGMIGSLLRLIRGAAIQAVLDGTELITRATLDSVGVDIASETADPGRRRRTVRDTCRRAAPAAAPRPGPA